MFCVDIYVLIDFALITFTNVFNIVMSLKGSNLQTYYYGLKSAQSVVLCLYLIYKHVNYVFVLPRKQTLHIFTELQCKLDSYMISFNLFIARWYKWSFC